MSGGTSSRMNGLAGTVVIVIKSSSYPNGIVKLTASIKQVAEVVCLERRKFGQETSSVCQQFEVPNSTTPNNSKGPNNQRTISQASPVVFRRRTPFNAKHLYEGLTDHSIPRVLKPFNSTHSSSP
ncbi:hypothetical protein RUM43_004439 [Polyplax serrata]|uniref:Uncharacterized protein n=1 Tax=Polyplax serrata TaxID=468196 RepID=A0AAN8SBZ8_POLSC